MGLIFLLSGHGASDCFGIIGILVTCVSFLTPLIFIKGPYAGLIFNPRKTGGESY